MTQTIDSRKGPVGSFLSIGYNKSSGCALQAMRASERKRHSPSPMLFALNPLYTPCEKKLLYPIVKKLPTGPMLVNRLVTEGMTEFIRNPEHKTSHLVRLTHRGKALLEEMWSRETESLNSLDHDLSIEDLQAAANVLHRLREALEKQQRDQEVTRS